MIRPQSSACGGEPTFVGDPLLGTCCSGQKPSWRILKSTVNQAPGTALFVRGPHLCSNGSEAAGDKKPGFQLGPMRLYS
ncbi:hypothetical protein SCLCIDRAFT_1212924 [Scleroderma citrinum Foug A]|uniref:Uncharacterized protein n=1 Tax=Scleroderma citrinum Foug A TaxID=1036808 RepID=A0A0C3DW77_9AGAM|nr:hypothetical protein SCLCIDRAFT_1212924 [Scleroderma citrinum Foug A]